MIHRVPPALQHHRITLTHIYFGFLQNENGGSRSKEPSIPRPLPPVEEGNPTTDLWVMISTTGRVFHDGL